MELPKAYFVLFQGQGAFIDVGFCIVNSLHFLFLEAYARLTNDPVCSQWGYPLGSTQYPWPILYSLTGTTSQGQSIQEY